MLGIGGRHGRQRRRSLQHLGAFGSQVRSKQHQRSMCMLHVWKTIPSLSLEPALVSKVTHLMTPEVCVGRSLTDPVAIHWKLIRTCVDLELAKRLTVIQEIPPSKGLDKGINARTSPCCNIGPVRQSFRRRIRVVLARQIAVRREGSDVTIAQSENRSKKLQFNTPITVIRPKAMDGPTVFWEQLTLLLESGVCVPELGLQNETSWCRRTASILDGRCILARKHGGL